MKKSVTMILFSFILVTTLLSVVSAEIIFNNQVKDVYNVGDSEDLSVTIKTVTPVSGNLRMYLICSGKQTPVYQNGVNLGAGEEKTMEASLIFDRENGVVVGKCSIKAVFGSEYKLTSDFEVSDFIVIQSKVEQIDYNPGENLVVQGDAIKKNGNNLNGFVDLKVVVGNGTEVEQLGTVNNGFFSANLTLPENLAAGSYLVNLNVYEMNLDGEQINKGYMNYNIKIRQIPTTLEVFTEKSQINPGEKLRVKSVLHDQTGEPISAVSIMTVKKSRNEILQQTEIPTDEYLEIEIPYNEAPANWTVIAVSSMLTGEANVIVKEKKEISVELVNETVLITNRGNVPYNDSVLLKIGANSVDLNVYLGVDEFKEYRLSAPDGEYIVEVFSDGQSRVSRNVLLTGKAVGVKEPGASDFNFVKLLVWVFAVLIVGTVAIIIYKKGRRGFFGRFKKKREPVKAKELQKVNMKELPITAMANAGNKAVLSLSIKGDRQEAGIICLRIKNLSEIKKEGIQDTMRKVDALVDNSKVFVYENQESLYFIFSPVKTKTFRNEKAMIDFARDLKEVLTAHNKVFKYKMDFGISVNNGYIVSRLNSKGELDFVGMGNILAIARKIANSADNEMFLSRDVKERAGSMIKTEDRNIDGMKVYTIKEMREREQYKEFINNFLRSQKRDEEDRKRREEKFG